MQRLGVLLLAVLVFAGIGWGWSNWQSSLSNAAPEQRATATTTPSPSAEPTKTAVPRVPRAVGADFRDGSIPAGFDTFESGSNETGFDVADGLLTHGAPTGDAGASYLEAELPDDVQRVGATAVFADTGTPGAIALIAWEESLVRKRTDENTLPRSGLHFVAYPGRWHLGIIDPAADQLEDIVERGEYRSPSGAHEFDLFRNGDTVWVVDPAGGVTEITDPRIEEYAGPWVNWELYEPTGDSAPASFREVWAG